MKFPNRNISLSCEGESSTKSTASSKNSMKGGKKTDRKVTLPFITTDSTATCQCPQGDVM